MFPKVVELVRENDELREEVGSAHNLKFYLDVFPFPLPSHLSRNGKNGIKYRAKI